MRLSVIIPVYNVERYVEKSIRSVLENGLKPGDFEVIVVDDGSPDGSADIVRRIVAESPAVKLISQENKGLGGARNTGIQAAKGAYLLFLDSDDRLLPGTLDRVLDVAEQYQPEILEFGARGVTNDDVETYRFELDTDKKCYDGLSYYSLFETMNSACNKLYSRVFILEKQLLFRERIYIEDFEFHTRVLPLVKKIMAYPLLVAEFLQSDDSITRNKDADKKKKAYRDFMHIIDLVASQKEEQQPSENSLADHFFRERLTYLVTTLFYQFFKNAEPYSLVSKYKKELNSKGIYADFPLRQKTKDLFRRIMVNNPWVFILVQPLKRFVS